MVVSLKSKKALGKQRAFFVIYFIYLGGLIKPPIIFVIPVSNIIYPKC